ncbi:unnamed protein product [Vitrella brassicaformis CCMP3155]|uniref:Uncharacterized protein n=1 Tax=Vitrella brassicaformis (strain CCMP3155) TaxID=1169540 RepID=A0A0G4FGN8_VITBC|nr:unnamed protein product [Vitrella brassicaformis CCMP3155]|eukprot:CEM12320.1 unnamed protein product [Vitrella brassicaformis CCMP3155]
MPLNIFKVFKKTKFVRPASLQDQVPVHDVAASLERGLASRPKPRNLHQDIEGFLPFGVVLAITSTASAAAWAALFFCWHKFDKEEVPYGMLQQVLSSRIVSHLGPYCLPHIVRSPVHDTALNLVADDLILDHERSNALDVIEGITQRRAAVRELLRIKEEQVADGLLSYKASPTGLDSAVKPSDFGGDDNDETEGLVRRGLMCFWPVVKDLVRNQTLGGASKPYSHLESQTRIILDLIAEMPPEDREVPYWWLKALVNQHSKLWGQTPSNEELRATLLCKLLQCPANCVKVYHREFDDFMAKLTYDDEPETVPSPPSQQSAAPSSSSSSSKRGDTASGERLGDKEDMPESTEASSRATTATEPPPVLVMEYLYQPGRVVYWGGIMGLSHWLLSGEQHDLYRRAIRLINRSVKRHYYAQHQQQQQQQEAQETASPAPHTPAPLPSSEQEAFRLDRLLSAAMFTEGNKEMDEPKDDGRGEGDEGSKSWELPKGTEEVLTLPVPLPRERKSRSLQTKMALRVQETNMEICALVALLSLVFKGHIRKEVFWPILMKGVRRCVTGFAVLELLWRAQEYIIQTDRYYNDPQFMLLTSAAMCVTNVLTWSRIFSTHRYVFGPYLFIRTVKDGSSDAYRHL